MDRISLEYAQKVRTIQSAIKTQNDILLNRISTIINRATLDAFDKLEKNLKEFTDVYQLIKKMQTPNLSPNDVTALHNKFLDNHIMMYQEHNLKSRHFFYLDLLNQISMSIGSL